MPRINRAPVNTVRGGMESVTVGGAVANIVVELMTWLPEGWSSPTIAVNVGVLVTAGVAMAASIMRNRGILPRVLPAAPTSLVVLLSASLLLTGCTGVIGTVEPTFHEVVDSQGSAIVTACTVKGVAWGGGDGGICRVDDEGYVNTVEGGNMGETFKDFGLGILEAAGRVVGGLFGGIGGAFSAIGAGASSDGS